MLKCIKQEGFWSLRGWRLSVPSTLKGLSCCKNKTWPLLISSWPPLNTCFLVIYGGQAASCSFWTVTFQPRRNSKQFHIPWPRGNFRRIFLERIWVFTTHKLILLDGSQRRRGNLLFCLMPTGAGSKHKYERLGQAACVGTGPPWPPNYCTKMEMFFLKKIKDIILWSTTMTFCF